MLEFDSIPAGGLFNWKLDIGAKRVYSLNTADNPRLPLFIRTGSAGSTAFLNSVFWLVFDKLSSTGRSLSRLFCSVDEMEALANSKYYVNHAAIGGAFPALSAVPKISTNLFAYLAGLIVVTQHFRGTADPRAADLGEPHANVVLQVLKLETDSNYTYFLMSKLVEWYQDAPKLDWHAPSKEDRGDEVDGDEAAGEGVRVGVRAQCAQCLIWSNESQQPYLMPRRRDRQT